MGKDMKQIDMMDMIGKGIAALRYIQEQVLTDAHIENVRDALAKMETLGEEAQAMLRQAQAFVAQITSDAVRSRGFGVGNKLSKAGVYMTYLSLRDALENQAAQTVLQESSLSDMLNVSDNF